MKGSIHHIEIYVSNLKKSIKFWSWFLKELGYKKFQGWKKGISYKRKTFYLVFVQVEDKYKKVSYHRKRIGLNHIAFHAESKQFIEKIRRKLIEKKINILYKDK